jgi:hypothetical protein
MGQPVDTSKTFVPIPPLPNSGNTAAGNQMYVVVSDERLDAALHGKILSKFIIFRDFKNIQIFQIF